MAENLARLTKELNAARDERRRLDDQRTQLGVRLADLVKRADAAGMRTGAIAKELAVSDQAVRDLRRGRYGTGGKRGRPPAGR